MPIQAPYLFTVSMDVRADKEVLFNQVYNHEHVPLLLEVPGVLSVARFKREELTLIIGGEQKKIVIEDEPHYTALYELAGPEVLVSEAWGRAVDRGRWPGEVRPFTVNRRHTLHRRLG